MACGRFRPPRISGRAWPVTSGWPSVLRAGLRLTHVTLGEPAQLGQPVRHLVQRRAGDNQQAEAADQGQQRRREPRREPGHQRRGDREADQPPAGLHGGGPGAGMRGAGRDVDEAERAEHQRGPADHHPPGLRVPVGMPQVAPGQQAEQERQQPGGRAEGAVQQAGDQPGGRVAHPGPRGWPRRRWPRPGRPGPGRPGGAAGPCPGRSCRRRAPCRRRHARRPSRPRRSAGPPSRPGSGSGRHSAVTGPRTPPRAGYRPLLAVRRLLA